MCLFSFSSLKYGKLQINACLNYMDFILFFLNDFIVQYNHVFDICENPVSTEDWRYLKSAEDFLCANQIKRQHSQH